MIRPYADLPRYDFSCIRIAGTSAAIALHAGVLMMLLVPTQWQPPQYVDKKDSPFIPVEYPKIEKTEKPLIRPVVPATTAKPKTTTTTTTRHEQTSNDAVTSTTGTEVLVVDQGDHGEIGQKPLTPTLAELSADIAPAPPYPALAVREGTTGRVLLRIVVDAQGRPVEGRIEKSSGSRLLDKAALQFVLANWHFNPAMQAGVAIGAIALVPIEFTLER